VIPLKPLESPDELPVVPFKRLDARDEAPRPRAARSRTDFEEDNIAERMFRPGGQGEALLRAVSGFGTFLSRLLDPISRLERGLPLIPPGRPEPSPVAPPLGGPMEVGVLADEVSVPVAAEPHRRSAAEDRLPIIPLKPLGDDGAPSAVALKLRLLWTRASAWIDGATAAFGRLVQREAPPPPRAPDERAPSRAPEPPPREPLVAPPSTSELPSLRFAKTHEPREVEDLYEDDEDVGFVAVGWLWIRRLVLVTVLVAGGVLAAKNWETWFPKAGELGNTMFVEVDERVRSFDVSERQMQAVQEAVERLPHLSSETIRLVMADSPAGVLDPPEVFGVACDASDRGLSALPPREVEELRELRVELLDTFRPSERRRVREYDRARARGVVFPYEHRVVLALVARGARALSPESRVRMQALSGKAIAAGLTLPIDVESPAAEP
jgi:hypothetical protein